MKKDTKKNQTRLSLLLLFIALLGLLALRQLERSRARAATELTATALFESRATQELEGQAVKDKVLTNIHSVEVNVLESAPPQISLEVAGEHPDGCDYPVLVEQARQDQTINIEVYREVPADIFCPMILRPYQGQIQLEGSFAPGRYTINVNSHSQTIDI